MQLPTTNQRTTREQARDLYLKRQRSKVIAQLKNANNAERKATIKHIDDFLRSTTPDGRLFWLKVRREVERQIESSEVKNA